MRSVLKFVCYVSLRSNKFLIISFTIQICMYIEFEQNRMKEREREGKRKRSEKDRLGGHGQWTTTMRLMCASVARIIAMVGGSFPQLNVIYFW